MYMTRNKMVTSYLLQVVFCAHLLKVIESVGEMPTAMEGMGLYTARPESGGRVC